MCDTGHDAVVSRAATELMRPDADPFAVRRRLEALARPFHNTQGT